MLKIKQLLPKYKILCKKDVTNINILFHGYLQNIKFNYKLRIALVATKQSGLPPRAFIS